jgi:hypothetical protein
MKFELLVLADVDSYIGFKLLYEFFMLFKVVLSILP